MTELNLDAWLRKQPQPVAVVATDGDGVEQRIEVGKNGRAWRDLKKTIEALSPSKLTCLNAGGSVLRSVVVRVDEDEKPESKRPKSELETFATLVAEAYEKGSQNYAPVVNHQLEFIGRQATALASAEQEVYQLRNVVAQQQLQINELTLAAQMTAGGGEDTIMGSLLAGMAQQQAKQQKKPVAVMSPGADGAQSAKKGGAK